jgi:hypothetical protein
VYYSSVCLLDVMGFRLPSNVVEIVRGCGSLFGPGFKLAGRRLVPIS